jgi:hypothetical protein
MKGVRVTNTAQAKAKFGIDINGYNTSRLISTRASHLIVDKSNSSSSSTFSGPYMHVRGIHTELPTFSFSVHVPMSTVTYFVKADDALKIMDELALQKARLTNNDIPIPTEVFAFVAHMRKEMELLLETEPSDTVWVCHLSQSPSFQDNVALVHPKENDKVQRWMTGVKEEFVDMIRYSTLLSGEGSEFHMAKARSEWKKLKKKKKKKRKKKKQLDIKPLIAEEGSATIL